MLKKISCIIYIRKPKLGTIPKSMKWFSSLNVLLAAINDKQDEGKIIIRNEETQQYSIVSHEMLEYLISRG